MGHKRKRKTRKAGPRPSIAFDSGSPFISKRDWALFALAAAVAIILWLVTDRSVTVTILALSALFVFLVVPTIHLVHSNVHRAAVVAGFGIGVFIFGKYVWPSGIGTLSRRDQDKMIAILKSETKPLPVHFMCPPNEERDCGAGAQFIRIFGIAGWPLVTQNIDRVVPGQPRSGVYFVLHSTADIDYSKPEFRHQDVGVWTEHPPGYLTAKKAFEAIGVDTGEVEGTTFPEHTLGVYFGVGSARR